MSLSRHGEFTRGGNACAECRRLKTRCDKRVPCSSCIRRSCEVLCPNSTMPPGEGSRFVNVAEKYLRQRIMKMEERMRLLEDALAIINGSASHKPPLLLDDKSSGYGTNGTSEVDRDSTIVNEFERYGLAAVLGSLYLDERAPLDPLFGGSESLLFQAKAFVTEFSSPTDHAEEIDSSFLPSEINLFYKAFPFTPPGIPTKPVQCLIESYLPPLPRASALFDAYSESRHVKFSMVSRHHILRELIPAIYGRASGQAPAQARLYGPHDIALLFVIFAIGALLDPSLPPYNMEAQHYFILSQAAMCLQPVFAQRSLVTVKALVLMGIYNGLCGIESRLDGSGSMINFAAQLALQIGLHKDPSVWGITGREAYDRRIFIWNLLYGTLWQCLVTGQPPPIMPRFIDCQIPTQEEEDMYQSGELPIGFGRWGYSFATECLAPVLEATQGARPPSYDAVLALDRRIREFSVSQETGNKQLSKQIHVFARKHLRKLTLFLLHRGFFAQALTDCPSDPLKSPLRHSVLTAYQSATIILNAARGLFALRPMVYARVWRVWSFTFSAATVVAAAAIKQLKFEPEPFEQLDLACTLFRDAACMGARAQRALPILLRLRQEAVEVRFEPIQRYPGKADDLPEEDCRWGPSWGPPDGCQTLVDPSGMVTHQPIPSTPYSEVPPVPANGDMQVIAAPVVHPSPAGFSGCHQELYASVVEIPHAWPELLSSTSLGSDGFPSAFPAQSQPPMYGLVPENQAMSGLYDIPGMYMHSYSH